MLTQELLETIRVLSKNNTAPYHSVSARQSEPQRDTDANLNKEDSSVVSFSDPVMLSKKFHIKVHLSG